MHSQKELPSREYTDEEKENHGKKLYGMVFEKHFTQVKGRVFVLSIIPLLIFGGIGYAIDYKFSTRPWFLALGVVIAFIVTQVLIVRIFNRITKLR